MFLFTKSIQIPQGSERQAAGLVVSLERIDEVLQILDGYLGKITVDVSGVMRELSMQVVLGHDAATELQRRQENHVNKLRRAGVGPRPSAAESENSRETIFSTVMSCGMRPRNEAKEQPAEPKRPPGAKAPVPAGRASDKSSGGGSILSGIIPGF